jgi:hypothetical protein
MTGPSTSARQAAVDAAVAELRRWNGEDEDGFEPAMAETIVAKVFAALAGDLFIARYGVIDGEGRFVMQRGDLEQRVWALLEAILPTRDERGV